MFGYLVRNFTLVSARLTSPRPLRRARSEVPRIAGHLSRPQGSASCYCYACHTTRQQCLRTLQTYQPPYQRWQLLSQIHQSRSSTELILTHEHLPNARNA